MRFSRLGTVPPFPGADALTPAALAAPAAEPHDAVQRHGDDSERTALGQPTTHMNMKEYETSRKRACDA